MIPSLSKLAQVSAGSIFLLSLICCTSATAGETRIAKVDLKQLYDHWPRFKGLREEANKQVEPLRKELEALAKTRAEQVKNLEKLRKDSKQEGMLDNEKRRLGDEVERALAEFQALNKRGSDIDNEIRTKLNSSLMGARGSLVKEVHAMCRLVARREKFNMLINVTLESEGVLMAEPEVATDITQQVQEELEKRAATTPLETVQPKDTPSECPSEEAVSPEQGNR
jgi:Skp family chaperone for outer membrane proteins